MQYLRAQGTGLRAQGTGHRARHEPLAASSAFCRAYGSSIFGVDREFEMNMVHFRD